METLKTIKGYELHERIGSGGFGVVHRAYQATVGREVAIKIILPHFANQPEFIRRFETEAQLVARLEHPFIVPLYDYWRDPDGAYLVMRWLRGGNLRDALAQGPFELEAAALFMDQITSALALAHRNGVIHRDLKPANILLDEDGNAYLSDFGIAKDIFNPTDGQTGTDVILGSPDYLSPEQARSEPVSPQTDIYSLGVMLYEVLTGQHPFPNVTSVERMYKHLNEPLPLIEALFPEINEGVNTIIQKATAKNPAQRYVDVLAMAADFRRETAPGQQSGENIVELLTLREQEILQMIADGCSNKDIAQRLFITIGTVKWHVRQVYQKLHVRSRVQAMVRARELNLLVADTTAQPTPIESTYVVLPEPENPYKGLRAFQMADARDFFGRERLIHRLVNRLSEHDRMARFLAVVGPSGSGKSSVVRAGLVPALWRGDLPGSEDWFIVEMIPGTQPLDELEIALSRVAANQAGNLREHLERDTRGLVRIAALILPDDGSELVVIVDQFEEVFTLVSDEARRVQFLDLLHTAVTDPRSRVRVVVTLRADFYDRPLHYPDFGELMRSRMETVLPLSAEELEATVAKPAARVGVSFEPGLVATITGDVHYQPGALPLLQYALTELFEQRSNRTLTHEAYQALGGAAGALAKRAEELVHEQDATGQEIIRQMFLRLVTLGEGLEDTRRRVPRSELLAVAGDEDRMDEAIDTYAAYRLLTLDHDPVTRSPTVEIAHEAILREWKRLRDWLRESRDDIRQQRILATAAAEWFQAERDPSYLLRGSRLEQFSGWATEAKLALTPKERDFLDTSLAEHQRQETAEQSRQQRELETQRQLAEQRQRSANRLRYLVVGLAVFLLAAVVLVIFAFDRESKAQDARTKAEREASINHSLVLSNDAKHAYEQGRTNLALALALEASRIKPVQPEAVEALRTVGRGYGIRTQWVGHSASVKAAAISPDSKLAVSVSCAEMIPETVCEQGELALWKLEDGVLIRRWNGHQDWVTDVAFNPDGTLILSGSMDGTLILWETETSQVLRTFETTNSPILSLAFVPRSDPLMAVSGLKDGTVALWNVDTGELLRVFSVDDPGTPEIEGHTGEVRDVVVSPDGSMVASGSSDKRIVLWDADTGNLVRVLEGNSTEVNVVLFLPPDGKILLSLSQDSRFRRWDVATGLETTPVITAVGGIPLCMSPTPDGMTVYLCMRFVWVWNVQQFEGEFWLSDTLEQAGREGEDSLLALAASPDGRFVLAGNTSGMLWVWNTPNAEIRRFPTDGTALATIAISADGRTLLTGTHDPCGGIVWNVETGEQVSRFVAEGGQGLSALGAQLTADGQRAMVACSDFFWGTQTTWLSLWDTQTGEELHRMEGNKFTIWKAAMSADGRFALTGSTTLDKTVGCCPNDLILWDLESGDLLKRVDAELYGGKAGGIQGLDLSHDGRLALFGAGEVVTLWDFVNDTAIRSYPIPGGLGEVAFSPDETAVLVTTTVPSLLKLDLESGAVIWETPMDTESWMLQVSSDSRYVLTRAINTGQIVIWDYQTGEKLQAFGNHESFPPNVVFHPSGNSVFSSGFEGHLIEWQVGDWSLETLLTWTKNNRYVRDLTCEERAKYRVEPLCE